MITVKTLHSLPNAFHFETVMKTLERVGAIVITGDCPREWGERETK